MKVHERSKRKILAEDSSSEAEANGKEHTGGTVHISVALGEQRVTYRLGGITCSNPILKHVVKSELTISCSAILLLKST